jgi:hypothetical protein
MSVPRADDDEITKEMIEAGAEVLLGELGGAVFSFWSAPDLAIRVYLAMSSRSETSRHRAALQSGLTPEPHRDTNETQ